MCELFLLVCSGWSYLFFRVSCLCVGVCWVHFGGWYAVLRARLAWWNRFRFSPETQESLPNENTRSVSFQKVETVRNDSPFYTTQMNRLNPGFARETYRCFLISPFYPGASSAFLMVQRRRPSASMSSNL